MADIGHEETEEVLKELEKRIFGEYSNAQKELEEKIEDYFRRFAVKDKLKLRALANGMITQKEYDEWKLGQVLIGERWIEMRDTIAEDLTHAAEIAQGITNSYMPSIYAINHNYGAFQVEQVAGVNTSYTLYDKDSFQRMFQDVKVYHDAGWKVEKHLNEGKLLQWNKKEVQSVMTQAILQGKTIPALAKSLHNAVGDSILAEDIKNRAKMTAEQISKELVRRNRNASIRNARTMTTGVQNAGRVDSYKRAEGMGIDLMKEWLATLDGRTRHEHRILDGQRVPVGEKFKVEGYEIEYPADPTAEAFLVYNCRCTLVPALKGFDVDSKDLSLRNTNHMGEASYEEWKNNHPSHSDPIDKQEKISEKLKNIYGAEYKKYNDLDEEENGGILSNVKGFLTGKLSKIKLKAGFYNGLKESYNDTVKNVLEKYEKEAKYVVTTDLRSKLSNGIIMLGERINPSTLAHELFHLIDRSNSITESGRITKNLSNNYTRIKYNALMQNLSIEDYFKTKYPHAFNGNKMKPEYRGMSDIIHACSDGQVYMGYGHLEKDYWKRYKKKERETFAQAGRMLYDNDQEVLNMFKSEFPDVFDEVMEILEEI